MKYLALLLVLVVPLTSMAQSESTLPDFDKLWNYGDPAATETKFRELLPQAVAAGDPSYHLQLITQIARTYSLRNNFDEAHKLLDEVEKQLTPNLKLARVRYLLERGRTFNSAGEPGDAEPLFIEAYELAESIGEMRHAIDAVHMVAIVQTDAEKQVEWNLKGIALADKNPEQKGWLNALYNNIGESYLKLEDYPNAHKYFYKLSEFQKARTGEADMYTMKDLAKSLRLAGSAQHALMMMHEVLEKLTAKGTDDGWIREELAEDYRALGNHAGAKPHFVKAYELLSKDEYCIKHEKEKLEHLKEMAE